jgi:hypothetical protein
MLGLAFLSILISAALIAAKNTPTFYLATAARAESVQLAEYVK